MKLYIALQGCRNEPLRMQVWNASEVSATEPERPKGLELIGKAPKKKHGISTYVKGQLDVPLTVYLWYLLCSLGILGDYNP